MTIPTAIAQKLKRSLVLHEGYRTHPYTDEFGNITIGVGYNLTSRGMSSEWIDSQYDEDANFFYNQLNHHFKWFNDLSDIRKIALLDMCYNVGLKNFLLFHEMIKALENKDYTKAAYEMKNSQWAKQVGKRADDLIYMMINDDYYERYPRF